VPGGGHNFIERLLLIAGQLGQINPLVLAVGIGAVALLLAGDRLLPGRPIALGVVIIAILLASVLGLPAMGFITGKIPSGLRSGRHRRYGMEVSCRTIGCLLLAYIESVSAARAFASKHG
jgi:MFS superfamily sulfate permease-like transporter